MPAISSIVNRRVSSTFCMEPDDTATPTIAGAIAGAGTSKITIAPGLLAALPYIAMSFPASSGKQLFYCRLPVGLGVFLYRVEGLRRVVCRQTEHHSLMVPGYRCKSLRLGGEAPLAGHCVRRVSTCEYVRIRR